MPQTQDIAPIAEYTTAYAKTITDTSEPVAWDYTYTLKPSDFGQGLAPFFAIERYNAMILAGCINNDVATRTITQKFALNDLESDTVVNNCLAGLYNTHVCLQDNVTSLFEDWKCKAGDVLKWKVWADASGVVDIQYNAVQVLPSRLLALGNYRSPNRNQTFETPLTPAMVTDSLVLDSSFIDYQRSQDLDTSVNWAPFDQFYDYDNVVAGERLVLESGWGHWSYDSSFKDIALFGFYGLGRFSGGKF
jgi:hypothetical protein